MHGKMQKMETRMLHRMRPYWRLQLLTCFPKTVVFVYTIMIRNSGGKLLHWCLPTALASMVGPTSHTMPQAIFEYRLVVHKLRPTPTMIIPYRVWRPNSGTPDDAKQEGDEPHDRNEESQPFFIPLILHVFPEEDDDEQPCECAAHMR